MHIANGDRVNLHEQKLAISKSQCYACTEVTYDYSHNYPLGGAPC
jgi:hypothetical protein